MEPKRISELIPANLRGLLLKSSEYTNEISIYKDELTDRCLVSGIAIIKKSFPALSLGFYDVFIDRLKANGFTDQRLQDAINHVIDTCVYPMPTIANFISFDKKYKIYSYEEMVRMVNDFGPEAWNNYKPTIIENRTKPVWVHIDDMIKYSLIEFKK